jgi:hypothetical protein
MLAWERQEVQVLFDLAGMLAVGVLAGLGLLHLYWAVRGSGGSARFLPEVGGRPAFRPTPLTTLAVAALLFTAALLAFGRLAGWGSPRYAWPFTVGTWGVAVAFLLRAIGNFGTVGFFKRVRGTTFARWDTRLFSPLCLGIALALIGLALS